MNTLGIDQSFTSTGIWLVNKNGQYIHHELIKTTQDKADQLTNFKRAKEISKRIQELISDYGINLVNIEGLAFGGAAIGNATRNLAGLQFIIVSDIIESGLDIEINIIAPTSLKKKATGKGNAKKDELLECCPDSVKQVVDPIPKTKGKYDLVDAYFLSVYDLMENKKK